MSRGFLFTARKGQMDFSSNYGYALFVDDLKHNEGKKYRIEQVKNPVSEALRRFYFGAVLPEVRETCEKWKDLNSEELHEVVKKMLFYFESYNPLTKRTERFGRSVMSDNEWNNTEKAMNYLDVVREYLAGCGREMPDSEDYKRERDLAPMNA